MNQYNHKKQRFFKRHTLHCAIIAASLNPLSTSLAALRISDPVEFSDPVEWRQADDTANIAQQYLLQGASDQATGMLTKAAQMASPASALTYANATRFWLDRFQPVNTVLDQTLNDDSIFTWQGDVYLYQQKKVTYLTSGIPDYAAYDQTSARTILGFEDHSKLALVIYENDRSKPIFSYQAKTSDELNGSVYGGSPLKLSDTEYIIPMYDPASYAGGYVSFLLYVDTDNKQVKTFSYNRGSHSINETCDRLYLSDPADREWLANRIKGRKTYVDLISEQANKNGHAPSLHNGDLACWKKHFSSSALAGSHMGESHPFAKPHELDIPHLRPESDIWITHSYTLANENFSGFAHNPDFWSLDERTGTLIYTGYPGAEGYDIPNKTGMLYQQGSAWYSGSEYCEGSSGGCYYKFCRLSTVKPIQTQALHEKQSGEKIPNVASPSNNIIHAFSSEINPKACFEFEAVARFGHGEYGDEHRDLANLKKDFFAFNPDFFNRSKFLSLLDFKTNALIDVENPGIRAGKSFTLIASANDSTRFFALYGYHLIHYRLNKARDRFTVESKVKLSLSNRQRSEVQSMRFGAEGHMILLTRSGEVIAFDTTTGDRGWYIKVTNVDDNAYLIGSDANNYFAVLGPEGFQLFDAHQGIPLSEPYRPDKWPDHEHDLSKIKSFIKIEDDGRVIMDVWSWQDPWADGTQQPSLPLYRYIRPTPPVIAKKDLQQAVNQRGIPDDHPNRQRLDTWFSPLKIAP